MYPRIMIAGTSGDSGKTMVALGLLAGWRNEGIEVAPFKKGPDYIDAAWLSLAAGRPAYNLDSWMMGAEGVLQSFGAKAARTGINIIESNRGLHDGEDARGTHSSAEIAKLLGSPVVLILAANKMTRTAAAIVLGMKLLDPNLNLAGVVLNRVANTRQENLMRTAIENEAGLPVLGAVPRMDENLLPARHLGLVTPDEHIKAEESICAASDLIRRSVDMHKIRAIAESAPAYWGWTQQAIDPSVAGRKVRDLRVGYFAGPAFTFYYPENLEAIDQAGAVRIAMNPLEDTEIPEVDALYIGGGFPETHAEQLANNVSFRNSVAAAAQQGLPVWAECGGLMFLARSIQWKESSYPMAGFLPVDILLGNRPAGHGYEEVIADQANPFMKVGTLLRGHEFHYSKIIGTIPDKTVFQVKRGTGLGNGRDGMLVNRTLASYMHIHSISSPEWIQWLVKAAWEFRKEKARS
jgi:cobyrinic acid a,c-diamide synthase